VSDDATEAPQPRPKRRYALERSLVGVVFFAITGAVIVNGAVRIWHDTYRDATVPSPAADCSSGIALLYNRFQMQLSIAPSTPSGFAPRWPLRDPEVVRALTALDEQLLALRPVCTREGHDAIDAYDSLTLWRYRAEDLARVDAHRLTPDAERALRYHSPGTHP
jgi:hypothetical protein